MSDPDAKVRTSVGTDGSAFEEAYHGYVQNVQEAQADLAMRLQNEYQKYLTRLSESQMEFQRSWSEVEQEHGRKVRDLTGQAEGGGRERLRDAQASSMKAAQEMQTKFQETMGQIQQDFAQTQQQICEEAQSRNEEALRDYVRALKSAWEQLDPESCDPRMVALAAQSMLAVALPATARSGA